MICWENRQERIPPVALILGNISHVCFWIKTCFFRGNLRCATGKTCPRDYGIDPHWSAHDDKALSFLRSPLSPCKKSSVIPNYDRKISSHCDLPAGRQAGRSEAISNTLQFHKPALPVPRPGQDREARGDTNIMESRRDSGFLGHKIISLKPGLGPGLLRRCPPRNDT